MTGLDFSIVICNYNYARFVGAAIDSCLAQHFPAERFEIIVVDDGSTDDSAAVLDRYADEPRIRVIRQTNHGQSAAFCTAIEAAAGRYICFLDSDDLFLPHKLRRVAERIAELDPVYDAFFMCHDLQILDDRTGTATQTPWFELVGLSRHGPVVGIDLITQEFEFSVPCGQVMSRSLALALAERLPTWEWRRGADGVFGHAALTVAGVIHYLAEPLGIYRVHGANHVAEIVDGQFRLKNHFAVESQRWPKLLHFLDSLIDSVPIEPKERPARIAYVRRLERQVRSLSSTRRFTQPAFAFHVLPSHDISHETATLDGCAAQTYGRVATMRWTADTTGEALLPRRHACVRSAALDEPAASSCRNLAQAYFHDHADYFCLIQAGDVPDPLFVERHMHAHRFSAICGVSACDIRYVDENDVLLHSGVFRSGGLWQRLPTFMPPFTSTLEQWHFPPLSACVLRRSKLLDALFRRFLDADMPDFEPFAPWLLLQFVQHTSGSVRIADALCSVRLHDAAEASYSHVVDPALLFGADYDPEIDATASFLFDLVCRSPEVFGRMMPAQWRSRLCPWLLQHAGGATKDDLSAIAIRHGNAECIAMLDATRTA